MTGDVHSQLTIGADGHLLKTCAFGQSILAHQAELFDQGRAQIESGGGRLFAQGIKEVPDGFGLLWLVQTLVHLLQSAVTGNPDDEGLAQGAIQLKDHFPVSGDQDRTASAADDHGSIGHVHSLSWGMPQLPDRRAFSARFNAGRRVTRAGGARRSLP